MKRLVMTAAVFAMSGGMVVCAATIPYSDPAAQGTQSFGGNLGLTFDVLSPISVIGLGVFNASGNGLITGSIDVAIFNTTLNVMVTPEVTFSGAFTDGALGFDVFQAIAPVVLGVGSYEVDAVGFSPTDLNGNLNTGSSTGPILNNDGGQLTFTGAAYDTSTVLDDPNSCSPGCQPLAGRISQFDAGTFELGANPAPEPSTFGLFCCCFVFVITLLCRERMRSNKSQN